MATSKMTQNHVFSDILGDAPFTVPCHRDSGDSPSRMPSMFSSQGIVARAEVD